MPVLMAALLLLPACSKDDPFADDDAGKPHGTASFKKMGVEVSTSEKIVRANAEEVDVNTFTVEVTGTNGKTYYAGTLADMPEILSLPVATGYTVKVHSPENPAAAWDTPYYEGTQTFDVKENEVTYVDPVVCKFASVKVSIVFDASLVPYMGDDCKVTVVTGNGATLTFTKAETRSGFFKYETDAQDQATLVATFSGTVDENYEENFRTYTAVKPGNHYIITYKLHGLDPDVPEQNGNVTLGVYVDSEVTTDDLTVNVDDEDDTLDDTDRPQEGGDEPGPGPGPGPDPSGSAPTVTLKGDLTDANWTTANVVPAEGMSIQVKVHSDHSAGLTAFTVDIDSETLTAEILDGVGLASHLDLVNPGKFEQGLRDLGFPVYVGGQQDPAEMDITRFTQLLGIYGAATHKFIITVSDANGTTTKTLTLVSK